MVPNIGPVQVAELVAECTGVLRLIKIRGLCGSCNKLEQITWVLDRLACSKDGKCVKRFVDKHKIQTQATK